jgi:predicted metal-dependent HD superfamily phosphohydrolase
MVDRLMLAYSEDHRFYHNMKHILSCHYAITSFAHLATYPDEIYIALWFHDAIYDPDSGVNEERSAEWLEQELAGVAPEDSIERMANMIRATNGHDGSYDFDTHLMLDIDLGILGSRPHEFDTFDQNIRKEYQWVPLEDYNFLRARVLQGFLDRDKIYHTEPYMFRETRARENLQRRIKELT